MNANKTRLSKSILEMKFMKRTKEKVENQLFQEEGEEYFCSQLTKRMKTEKGQFIIEPSYVVCEQLIEGRLSFQGMNPELEKLMDLERKAKSENEHEIKEETDVTKEEMAKFWHKHHKHHKPHIYHYQSNENNRDEPVRKKPKFLKPKD